MSVSIGAAVAEQELDALPQNATPFTKTTPATDLTFTADASTNAITTSAPHGNKKGDGPFPLTTTGTLPGGLATGTRYWSCDIGASTMGLANSGINAIANTEVDLTDAGTGTHTLVRAINTQASGSGFIVGTAKGDWDAAPSATPTDNKGNTYTLLGTVHAYAGFAASKTAFHYCINATGGTAHTFSVTGKAFDEVTIWAIEIKGMTSAPSTHSYVERASGATITSASVTVAAPSLLIAVVWGNGVVGQDHAFTPTNGFTKIPEASREQDMLGPSGNGYIQVTTAYQFVTPGTYTAAFSGVASEGAQMYLVAIPSPTDAAGGSAGMGLSVGMGLGL